jgi:hypothetical protein
LRRYVNSQEVPPVAATLHEKPAFWIYLTPFRKRPALAYSLVAIAFAGILFFAWFAGLKPAQHNSSQSAAPAAVVPLVPGSMRSAGAGLAHVQVPPQGSDVKLELEVTNNSFQNYRSELFRENKSLKTIGDLKVEKKNGEQHVVPVTIPGDLLSPGDYQLRLSGVLDTGADEFIDKYSFRVIE